MSHYSDHPDPAAAIALARQYSRLCPEYPEQLLSLPELKIALGRGCLVEALPEQFTDPVLHSLRLRRCSELALQLLGAAGAGAPQPHEIDRAIYLTVRADTSDTSEYIQVDYGHDLLALMHYAAYQPDLVTYPLAGYPELVASDLMRQPYWDGEEITEVMLSELLVDGALTAELAAEIHIRWI